MTEKKKRALRLPEDKTPFRTWKKRRDIQLASIVVEVDLDNREIIFPENLKHKLNLDISLTNVDQLITNYVDPKDSAVVKDGLTNAQRGLEQPIRFHFIHPTTAERLQLEYHYEIVYVRYASTRLNGLLVSIGD